MHYLFDFDGTLADSMPTWAGFHISMLKEYGIPCPDGFVKTITPLGNIRASEYTISLGVDLTLDEYLARMQVVLSEQYGNRILLKKGVEKTIRHLISKGHTVHVFTASPHKYIDPCLKRNGIYELFDKVWSIDDFGYPKSEVIIYEEAAKRLGVQVSDCVFIDDNLTCCLTGKKAGMTVIGIYDETSSNLVEDIKNASDRYVYEFDEIIDIEF